MQRNSAEKKKNPITEKNFIQYTVSIHFESNLALSYSMP